MNFGTDGVRGRAYTDLTLDFASSLARAAAHVLGGTTVVVGRDTRASGPDFVSALAAGFGAEGVEVLDLGVAPTPAVAYVCSNDGIAGAMVSASHNPWYDNGIKLFAVGGTKLSDETQSRLQSDLAALDGKPVAPVVPTDASRRRADYADHVAATVAGSSLSGLHVVVDAANGALAELAAPVLEGLGCRATTIHAEPDGENINRGCGSTEPGDLQRAVVSARADVGLAFDGDADRLIAVDGEGNIVDGDHIIAICAVDRHERGQLVDDTVVVTVMTNFGFRLAMAERGVNVHETAVGDRNVLSALEANGWSLGGEQSGHVIFADLATTGDGLLTAVQLLDVVARRGRPLAELASVMRRLPQVLENVAGVSDPHARIDAIATDIARVEAALGEHGRVLVRASGTEPLVRVMAEAESHDQAEWAVATLVTAVNSTAGTAP